MKPARKEVYVIINGIAYDIYRMPFWKRWKLQLLTKLGRRIDSL